MRHAPVNVDRGFPESDERGELMIVIVTNDDCEVCLKIDTNELADEIRQEMSEGGYSDADIASDLTLEIISSVVDDVRRELKKAL